ncbi:MAG: putative Peptide chain release factor eRF3, partial [Streblomastix strix]
MIFYSPLTVRTNLTEVSKDNKQLNGQIKVNEKIIEKDKLKDENMDDEEDDENKQEFERENKKQSINLVFLGPSGSGKSTTCGHILDLKKMVDQRLMEKNRRESIAKGGEDWKYSFVLDELEQERQFGSTWECGHASFYTQTKLWNIIDAPGLRHFINHTIAGISQAEVAILIVSAKRGEFETSFQRDGQTREQVIIARTMGIQTLIVAVNKMDDVGWNQERFNEVKSKMEPFLRSI